MSKFQKLSKDEMKNVLGGLNPPGGEFGGCGSSCSGTCKIGSGTCQGAEGTCGKNGQGKCLCSGAC